MKADGSVVISMVSLLILMEKLLKLIQSLRISGVCLDMLDVGYPLLVP